MKKRQNKRQLFGDKIGSEPLLDSMLDELMGFPGWHSHRRDEWLDMVMLGTDVSATVPHLRTADEVQFVLEIVNSETLLARPGLAIRLLKLVTAVNRRSQERGGTALVTVAFL
jgi:hypothetical protein